MIQVGWWNEGQTYLGEIIKSGDGNKGEYPLFLNKTF